MYTIIQHIPSHDFAIVSEKERCYYNDGKWTNSINNLLRSPHLSKKYFNKHDTICGYSDFNDFLTHYKLISIINISTLDYRYIKTNYPELLI